MFCPKANKNNRIYPVGDFKGFKLPKFQKVKMPKITIEDITNHEPMISSLVVGGNYWAKKVSEETWVTCTEKDIHDPNYAPHIAIEGERGCAIYDGNLKPIVCTDREIFKNWEASPEEAGITRRNEPLGTGKHFRSKIFFMPE
jgi:hypothetical protein